MTDRTISQEARRARVLIEELGFLCLKRAAGAPGPDGVECAVALAPVGADGPVTVHARRHADPAMSLRGEEAPLQTWPDWQAALASGWRID